MRAGFWFGNLKEKDRWENLDDHGGNTETNLRRTGWSGVGRINLAQNGDKCRALVNTLTFRRLMSTVVDVPHR
jgi:hypothetical protein